MVEQAHKTVWASWGGSTRGSSHLRSGLPNQDALGTWADPDGTRAILVVSDGHGSAKHFRSDTGSKLAVQVTIGVLQDCDMPMSNEQARALVAPIVGKWRDAIREHLENNAFRAEEWEHIPPAEREQGQAAILANPAIAYGATLLAVLALESDVMFLQLGDGDMLCVDDQGATTRPMPEDRRLIANQTTSLCQEDAVTNFRLAHLGPSNGPLPTLILASSDGYSNSFQAESDFLQVGSDYLGLVRQYGAEQVQAQLDRILGEASKKGSGDDITLGFIERRSSSSAAAVDAAASVQPATVSTRTVDPASVVATASVKAASTQSTPARPITSLSQNVTPQAPSRSAAQEPVRSGHSVVLPTIVGVGLLAAVGVGLAYLQPDFLPSWYPHLAGNHHTAPADQRTR